MTRIRLRFRSSPRLPRPAPLLYLLAGGGEASVTANTESRASLVCIRTAGNRASLTGQLVALKRQQSGCSTATMRLGPVDCELTIAPQLAVLLHASLGTIVTMYRSQRDAFWTNGAAAARPALLSSPVI